MDEKDLRGEPAAGQESAPESADEQALRRLLERAGPRPEVPQEDLEAISATLRSAWQFQARRQAAESQRQAEMRRPAWPLVAALAAGLALAVGLVWWWVSRTSRDDRVPPTVAWVEEVKGLVDLETPTNPLHRIAEGDPIPLDAVLESGGEGEDGRASLRLPDGTNVRLDLDTRLRLVSAATLELERGGIYVDTDSGPRWPRSDTAIEVRTPLGTLRDVGTQFAVRVVEAEMPALLVRVREGAIVTEHQGTSYLTPAGQELLLRRDGTAVRGAAAGFGPAWDWLLGVSPGFDVENRSLQDFLDWVSRETGWRIALDPGLGESATQIMLHGSIGELRPDEAPFAVLPGAGLEGELDGGTLVVRRRGQTGLRAPR
jgi:ferric-dicitrate binding protein FerR (iron transport regulator)